MVCSTTRTSFPRLPAGCNEALKQWKANGPPVPVGVRFLQDMSSGAGSKRNGTCCSPGPRWSLGPAALQDALVLNTPVIAAVMQLVPGKADLKRPVLCASDKEITKDGRHVRGLQSAVRPGLPQKALLSVRCSGGNLVRRRAGRGDVLGLEGQLRQVNQRILILSGNEFARLGLCIHAGHGARQGALG